MTAKEKAVYFVDLMQSVVIDSYSDQFEKAKECALICVEEIDRIFCSIPLEQQYSYLFELEYWQDVKKEIKNFTANITMKTKSTSRTIIPENRDNCFSTWMQYIKKENDKNRFQSFANIHNINEPYKRITLC